MTAIDILQSHILDTKAHIKILESKDVKSEGTADIIRENIYIRKREIQELEDAIAILAKSKSN